NARETTAGFLVASRSQRADQHRGDGYHPDERYHHQACDERDQERPETALEIFAEVGKIEIGESLVVLVVPSPKPPDGPAEDHDLAHEWNQRAGAAEKQVHRPLRAFEEIGDGGGVVHGDALVLTPSRDWKQGRKKRSRA